MKSQDKEFQGRSLDEAIAAACAYFDLPREKLEIDILSDAKAGIFGLVGSRKASIMARPAPALESFSVSLQMSKDSGKEGRSGREDRDGGAKRDERRPAPPEAPKEDPEKDDSQEQIEKADRQEPARESKRAPRESQGNDGDEPASPENRRDSASTRERVRGNERRGRGEREERNARGEREEHGERSRPRRDGRSESARDSGAESGTENGRRGRRGGADRRPRQAERPGRRENRDGREDLRQNRTLAQAARQEKDAELEDLDNDQHMAYEGLPEKPLADLPAEKLLAASREVMEQILRPLCPDASLEVALGDERVDVSVGCGDDAALLIGREGQTLAAMQYLLTRIVGRSVGAAVNMHLDIGDYRKRQDDKLRELALILADRVRESGRAQFTRPLSSYHRRIVHMALQGEEDLITRSKGEGALKRVSVAARSGSGGPARRQERRPARESISKEPDAELFNAPVPEPQDDEAQNFAPANSPAAGGNNAAEETTAEQGQHDAER